MVRQPKRSFIDQQEIASHFTEGQIVMHVDPLRFRQAPYEGVVEKVHRGIGQVDVRFPFGVKRLAPEELIPSGSSLGEEPLDYPDDEGDSGDLSVVIAARYMAKLAGITSEVVVRGSEMNTYNDAYQKFASVLSDGEIRRAVKTAMYWKSKGRVYAPTSEELESGCFSCPRCKTEMRQTVYKKRTKLYACPSCLFLIKPSDILECVDDDVREETKRQLGWTDPSTAFNSWL